MSRKKNVTKDSLTEMYMDYFLSNSEAPKSVYQFAQLNNFSEKNFYNYFGNFMAIEQYVFISFYDQSRKLLEKSEDYGSFDARNKLLSFYYTFFELLSANRSFVLLLLKEEYKPWNAMASLSPLKEKYVEFIKELNIVTLDLREERIEKFQEKSIQQSSWMQMLITLNFWIKDVSPSFEKTDVFIEKSINTSFDLLDVKPLKSIIDLGKFMFHEKIGMN